MSSASGLSAMASLYGGCAQVILLACLHSFTYPLGINIQVRQNPVLAFYKVFRVPGTESTREKQNITAKSLLLVKFCTDCMLQVCRKKGENVFFICVI